MAFDKEYFQNNMLDIRNEIDDFMCLCSEMSRPCNDIKLQDTPDDLLALLHRVLGDSSDILQAVSFHSLLRSILSAAVCEWVLECDVREPMITGCPLRDAMLSHLTAMGQLYFIHRCRIRLTTEQMTKMSFEISTLLHITP